MRKFLKHIFLFTLILIAVNAILYFTGRELYFGSYEVLSLERRSYFLSDSRGQALNDLTEKYGVHNFSHGSDSYEDMLRKLRYLVRSTHVDTVYISVDGHSLTSYRERKNNLDRSVIYCTAEDLGGRLEYFKQRYVKRYLPIFRPEIAEVIKIYKPASGKKPKMWADRSTDDRIKRAEKRVRTNFPEGVESEKLKEALIEIMRITRQNNIELIGIKLPLTREYNSFAEEIDGTADDMLIENGFKVTDFSKIFENEPEYFADQDHLNSTGAQAVLQYMFGY